MNRDIIAFTKYKFNVYGKKDIRSGRDSAVVGIVGKSKSLDFPTMLIFWSLVRNSVVLAVYLLFSVACFLTVHEHYTADANSIRYAEMAMTAIYNIAGYYGIDTKTFLLRNTDFFSYDNDYRNVRDGKIIVAHDNYAASDSAMLKAMCLERMNLPLNDLSSILKLSDPYKYVNVYARNAEPYSVIVLSDCNALPCNMMPVNRSAFGGVKMLDYIAFLKVLADAAKVRLCLVLDMPYSKFSKKIEEELSDYYLIKYNNDAELTFGGAI